MRKFALFLLILIMMVTAIVNLLTGARDITLHEVADIFLQRPVDPINEQIILYSRLPRVIGSILIGGSLAATGLVLQTITKNPLADTGLLGINASASVGIALLLAISPAISFGAVVIVSCCFSALSLIVIFYFAHTNKLGSMNTNIVLLGMIISLFMSACATALSIYFNINKSVMYWSVGGTSGIHWGMILFIAPLIIIGLLILAAISKPLSILLMGDSYAASLGINIYILYAAVFIIVFLLSGASVAIAGSISFVGIIAPHIVRVFISGNIQQMIPFTIIIGSILVVCSDIISRIVAAPFIAPIGSIIAFIGVPIFIYIAERKVRI